ncbi:MAG TPA: hypothetical protein IGS51_07970, partial [Thermoleptolyngbya sp. M55_K2018_002]|nr:hypothetical protein [Thermoleptolyngbya sp. M55_K2018_002]
SANPTLPASPISSPLREVPAPPAADTPDTPLPERSAIAPPGADGWVALSDLRPLMMPNPMPTDAQRGVCVSSSPTPDLPAPPPSPPPVAPPAEPTTPPSAPPASPPVG